MNEIGTATSTNALLQLLDSPYVSAVQATAGARSALISWNTVVPANSQVQFDTASFVIPGALSAAAAAQGSFSASSYIDPQLTTTHVVLLTGLEPGTRYSYQTLATEGTNTYVSAVYQFTTAGSIILDNSDATFTGSWTDGNLSPDKYSSNYWYTTTVGGSATATATWRPNIATPGKYDVFIWYPQGSNRANNAPFLVSYNGGNINVAVNQQSGGGGWQLIAPGVDFAKGTNGFVRLANNANPSVVIADAVRFSYVESQDFPTNTTVPQWWRDFFFGGATDPTLDGDADGYTTAQEYVMGTNPTNFLSHLDLAGSSLTNKLARFIFWPLLANRSYELIYRTNLTAPVWQKAASGAPAGTPDGHGYFSLGTTNNLQSYFRLKVQLTTNSDGSTFFAIPAALPALSTEAACGPYRIYVR
jgi:hypothetical protein